jgi:hypothetical protein
MSVIKIMAAGTGLLLILIIGSCAAIGYTTVATVNGLAKSDAAHKTGRKLDEWELKAHNEIGNRDAPYHEYSDYNRDYYDNY